MSFDEILDLTNDFFSFYNNIFNFNTQKVKQTSILSFFLLLDPSIEHVLHYMCTKLFFAS